MKKRTYSDEELKVAVSKSRAYSQVLKNLGLVQAGGTQGSVKLHIERLNLDISHFSHQLWNKGKSLEDYSSATARRNCLIKERGLKCERCSTADWLGEPITLEVHHVDGNKKNNQNQNLKLLCPNCHSITPNWRRKNKMVVTEGFEPPL